MDHAEKMKEFYLALNRLKDSSDGKIILKMLESLYVDQTAVSTESTELTYYRLGQKEFVQGLIKDSERDISEIESVNHLLEE